MLKMAASVILPFVIAVLLAFVMFPLLNWLDKFKIPRFISILLIVIIMAAIFYSFGVVIYTTGTNITSLYPKYEERITMIYKQAAGFFELPFDETQSFWDNIWGQLGIRTWVRGFAFSFSKILLSFLTNAALVIIFMVFVLLEASYFKEKIGIAFEGRSDQINKMGKDLMDQVTRYLTAKFFISLVFSIVIAVGLLLIGVEFAVLWGILSFVLNFIPNFGSIVGGFIIGVFSLVQFWPEPVPVIITVVFILTANMILGNILDPKIVGDQVGLSTLVVLVSLVLWGYIWGFAGMVLAVPLTSIIKIVCENIPILEPVSILLGSRKAVKVKKAKQETPEEQEIPEA